MDQLKNKTLKGLMYLGMGKGAAKLISFVNTLILARLLTPEDYGLMAIVMVIVGFIGFFNEIGLGAAIKHRAEISKQELNGAFCLAVLISSALYGALYLASPWLAGYFGYTELAGMLAVVSLTFIIGALSTVPDALLAREMRFKAYAGIEFAMILLQCVVTLVLAWLGFKAWSLVWGFIAAQSFRSICLFLCSNWLPTRLGDMRAAMGLMKFGAAVTYSRITWYLYNSAKTPIITKVLGASAMGVYSMASTLATLPTQYITSLVIQTSVPLFARMQKEPERLDNALRRLTSGIALLSFPIFLGMGMTAAELVPVVLGNNWLEAVPILQVLCVIGLVKSVDPLITQAFFSIGKPSITASYTTLCAVTIPLSVYIGVVNGGLMGAAYALLISYPLSSVYLFVQARRHLHFSLRRYFKALQTPLEAALFMCASVWLTAWFCYQQLQLIPVIVLLVKVVTGVLSYGGYLIYVRRDGLKDCHEVLLELGIKAEKLNRWPFNRLVD